MFNLIYQTALFLLALIALPKLLWQWWMLGKYKESLRERLGISLPPSLPHAQVIWIHAVSVGRFLHHTTSAVLKKTLFDNG
jgi:3-deoxy-D-manno-octulosonic-acid transferase